MDELWWNEQRLTDNDLSMKFKTLSQEKTYKKVDFSYNSLQCIPNFTQHNQFECVEDLSLFHNNIVSVDTERLPCNVKLLNMSSNQVSELVGNLTGLHRLEVLWLNKNRIHVFNPCSLPANIQVLGIESNQLTDMPDVSQCHLLRKLYLSGNQITDLDSQKVPLNIEQLDIRKNKVAVVRNFSRHKKLRKLYLDGNQIMTIYDTNRDMSSWIITVFDEKFFKNKEGYKHLLDCGLKTGKLRQPPEEVFKRGLKSIQTYFKDMALSKRVRHSRKRYVVNEIKITCAELSEYLHPV